jgi:hypothetical protein
MSPAFSKFVAGGREGGRGGRGQSGRGGRGGRGGGRNMGRSKDGRKGGRKKDLDNDKYYKLTFNAEEQEWINRQEQGVVTEYTPSATLADLEGYGPALATDTSLGKIESAMRSMRILAGGKPFCADGYYTDAKASLVRYHNHKKPIFFDDAKEKEWLEQTATEPLKVQGPDEKTKAAIIQSAIQGKYTAPSFAGLKDTMEILAKYHVKEATWKPTDGEAFDAKVRSLLPRVDKAPAAQPKAR